MKRILIVDDEFPIIEVLTMVLSSDGFSIESAANGLEGLRLMREQPFDLVLLDIMMPVMDGVEMLARLQADPELKKVPVILMSAAGSPENFEIKQGYEAYLAKPFNLKELLTTIRKII